MSASPMPGTIVFTLVLACALAIWSTRRRLRQSIEEFARLTGVRIVRATPWWWVTFLAATAAVDLVVSGEQARLEVSNRDGPGFALRLRFEVPGARMLYCRISSTGSPLFWFRPVFRRQKARVTAGTGSFDSEFTVSVHPPEQGARLVSPEVREALLNLKAVATRGVAPLRTPTALMSACAYPVRACSLVVASIERQQLVVEWMGILGDPGPREFVDFWNACRKVRDAVRRALLLVTTTEGQT